MRIKRFRDEAGLTQGQLAARIGTNQSTIARWEKGETEPSLEQLRSLAFLFKKRIEDLIQADDYELPIEFLRQNVLFHAFQFYHGYEVDETGFHADRRILDIHLKGTDKPLRVQIHRQFYYIFEHQYLNNTRDVVFIATLEGRCLIINKAEITLVVHDVDTDTISDDQERKRLEQFRPIDQSDYRKLSIGYFKDRPFSYSDMHLKPTLDDIKNGSSQYSSLFDGVHFSLIGGAEHTFNKQSEKGMNPYNFSEFLEPDQAMEVLWFTHNGSDVSITTDKIRYVEYPIYYYLSHINQYKDYWIYGRSHYQMPDNVIQALDVRMPESSEQASAFKNIFHEYLRSKD